MIKARIFKNANFSWPLILVISICCLGLLKPERTAGQTADSLLKIAATLPIDTQKVRMLNDAGWELLFDYPSRAKTQLFNSLSLAQSINDQYGRAQAYNHLGVCFAVHNDIDSAKYFYELALPIRDSLGDKKGVASLYNNLGNLAESQGKIEEALQFLRRSETLRRELRDSVRLARISNNIANVYESLGDYNAALDYAFNYLSLSERLHLEQEIHNAHFQLGNIKYELERYDEARLHYNTSFDYWEEEGDSTEMSRLLSNMGNVEDQLAEEYTDGENYQMALPAFKKALDFYSRSLGLQNSLQDTFLIGNLYNNMAGLHKNWGSYYQALDMADSAQWNYVQGLYLLDQGLSLFKAYDYPRGLMEMRNTRGDIFRRMANYEEALSEVEAYMALAKELNDQKFIQYAHKDFSRNYSALGNYKDAFIQRKEYDKMRYERINEERTRQNAEREARYGDTRKQLALEQQKREISEQNIELERARAWRNTLGAGALGLILTTLLLYNRYRLKNKSAKALAEKNAIIEEERQRSESLLLNILPEETAQELKSHGKTQAKRFEHTSVLFSDFKGFTSYAESTPPESLVASLHECFSAFDAITEKYGVEKIKTIGDAYMCVSGLPTVKDNHAELLIGAAMEMQEFAHNWNNKRIDQGLAPLYMRIGIHSGPVVAGIVGKKKFAYDIWGDTVNVASRMESASEPGRINISEETYKLIKGRYICKFRGELPIKNRGEMKMYWIEGEKDLAQPQDKTLTC